MIRVTLIAMSGILMMGVGCSSQSGTDRSDSALSVKPTGHRYLTDTEPAGAVPVGEARQNAENGEDVTLVGHIGGSAEPFVEGLAAFTIVDTKVPYCRPEEGCQTPWDYCCTQNQVKNNIATIQIVDDQGQLVTEDARRLLAVKELALVVVQGKAKRDDQGNFSVLAKKVFIR